jgi:hypothetical protein
MADKPPSDKLSISYATAEEINNLKVERPTNYVKKIVSLLAAELDLPNFDAVIGSEHHVDMPHFFKYRIVVRAKSPNRNNQQTLAKLIIPFPSTTNGMNYFVSSPLLSF